jgi:hypothetical protein
VGVEQIRITKWEDLANYNSKDKPRWLYRGVKNRRWDPETSLERCLKRNCIPRGRWAKVEEGLIREFRRACHQFTAHVPDSGHILEMLALMQHHGAPTRLLDVSYSINIALYFALEDVDVNRDKQDAAIWGLNGPWALSVAANCLEKFHKIKKRHIEDSVGDQVDTYLFDEHREISNKALFFGERRVSLVSPINAYRLNERLRTQKGIFLNWVSTSLK